MSAHRAQRGLGPLVRERAPLWGVYTGYIRDVSDPQTRGRIRVYCPTVMGETDNQDNWLDWALPCFSWVVNQGTGKPAGAGFIPAAAQPGSDKWGVHIQFREGDIRFPLWTGVFPLNALDTDDLVLEASKMLTLKVGSNQVIIDGPNKKISVRTTDGSSVVMDGNAQTITAQAAGGDSVVVDGTNHVVTINGSAHPLPLFDTFESQLSSFATTLIAVLSGGTSGSPAAQQLTLLSANLASLNAFITNLGNGTFNSVKAKNG